MAQELLYSIISRHGGSPGSSIRPLVLCEFTSKAATSTGSHCADLARRILDKVPNELPSKEMKATYTHEEHAIHVMVDGTGMIFMVMLKRTSDIKSKQRLPFAFLDDVRNRFAQRYGANLMVVTPNDVTSFASTLEEQMAHFSKGDDDVKMVMNQIQEVKDAMVDNVDKILQRGGKMQQLVDRTNDIKDTSYTFKSSAAELTQKAWQQSIRRTMLNLLPIVVGTFCLVMYCRSAVTSWPTILA